MALLDLCAGVFERVQPYFMYIVPALGFQERYLAYLERRYRLDVLRYPHPVLNDVLRSSGLRFASPKDEALPRVSEAQFEAMVRRDTGLEWIVTGQKMNDSLQRRGMISACDGISDKRKRAFPMAVWSDKQVFSYMKMKNIPLHSFGRFYPVEMATIKRLYPEDFERIKKVVPLAEATVQRLELYPDEMAELYGRAYRPHFADTGPVQPEDHEQGGQTEAEEIRARLRALRAARVEQADG